MNEDETPRRCEILLVEDNPADARLTREVMAESPVPTILHHVKDGVEALQFLHREGRFRDAVTPDLLLLDLNLPRKDGREVLQEMKCDPHLAIIPVVVLTTSEAEQDILKSYALHANCYLTKPGDLQDFIAVVRAIESFWLTAVALPTRLTAGRSNC